MKPMLDWQICHRHKKYLSYGLYWKLFDQIILSIEYDRPIHPTWVDTSIIILIISQILPYSIPC